jgi:hypothetical protein
MERLFTATITKGLFKTQSLQAEFGHAGSCWFANSAPAGQARPVARATQPAKAKQTPVI